jgi:hypothetical protein
MAMDEVAREYLLIGLSLGQLQDGIVDAYYGPAEVAQAARAANANPLELIARAAALRARLDEVADAQRARWLDRQLLALETLARQQNGEDIAYVELVERCFDATPDATPPEEYAHVRTELDELLPGTGDIRDRLAARDDALTVPADRLNDVLGWLAGELRASAAESFAVPGGEALTISLVTNEPWAAYNWYDGNLQSRIEVNTDLPVRASGLVGLLAHEAFPGHHLEHASKEQHLVREQGRYEASIQLINTPEAFISEGLAEVGVRFVAPPERWQQMLLEICQRAGIAMTIDDAQRQWRISRALHRLRGSGGDAALQLHVAGRSREQVIAFLEQDGLSTRERAEKSLEFITDPLWRAYVFCYAGGDRLLTQWIDRAGNPQAEVERFGRLLSEELTPSGIAADMAASAPSEP